MEVRIFLAGVGEYGPAGEWSDAFPIRFSKSVVAEIGLSPLTMHALWSLITAYADMDKQSAMTLIIQQLVAKRCIQEMGGRRDGSLSGAQKIRGLADSHRYSSAQQVSIAGYI